MAKYINKAVAKAKLLRKMFYYKKILLSCCRQNKGYYQGKVYALNDIISFLDTLEVKEVDLEKEFDNYANGILACDIRFEPYEQLYDCAKYFFELGLKAQQKGG